MKKILILAIMFFLSLSAFGKHWEHERMSPMEFDEIVTNAILDELSAAGYTILPEVVVTAYRNPQDTIKIRERIQDQKGDQKRDQFRKRDRKQNETGDQYQMRDQKRDQFRDQKRDQKRDQLRNQDHKRDMKQIHRQARPMPRPMAPMGPGPRGRR